MEFEITPVLNAILAVAFVFTVLFLYHFGMMFLNLEKSREFAMSFFMPFALLFSRFFTPKGLYHRRRAFEFGFTAGSLLLIHHHISAAFSP